MQSKRISRHLPSFVAMLPTTLFVVIIYLGCMAWTVAISFTTSKVLPVARWAGATQYERLLATERWTVSVHNILIYGACYILGCLVLGFLTAVAIDQKVRFELDGGARPASKKLRIKVHPSSVTVCVPPGRRG